MKTACFFSTSGPWPHMKKCHIISHYLSIQTSIHRLSGLSLHTNSFLLQLWQIKLSKACKACWAFFLQMHKKGFSNACVVITSKQSDTQSWSIKKYQSWRLITMYKTVIAEHLFDMIRFRLKVEVWQGMKNHHHFLISKRKKYYKSNDMTIVIRVICVHVMRHNCQ